MTRLSEQVATITVNITRNPAFSGSKRGAAVAHLSNVRSTPILPIEEELVERLNLGTMIETKQAYVYGALDIQEGDFLVYGSTTYRIRAVGEWIYKFGTWLRLILEEDKGV